MQLRIFSPLSSGTLEENQLGYVNCDNVEYTEKLYDTGNFSISTSANEDFTNLMKLGTLVWIKDKGVSLWGVIKAMDDINALEKPVNRYGDSLTSYLSQRITTVGSNGFDSVKGSTEQVVKYFVDKNLVNPVDDKRKIPYLVNATNQNRGIQDDKYMVRYMPVIDVVRDVCMTQKLGFKIDMDVSTGNMYFDVIQGIDRTAFQDERPRVIFDVDFGTAKSSDYVEDLSNYKNLFYTSKTGAENEQTTTTLTLWRKDETEPTGLERFESTLNVTVDNEAVDIIGEMQNIAYKEMTNFEREVNFKIALNGNLVYNKDYKLGDFVTIQDRGMSIIENVQLIEVTHQWSRNGYTLVGTFGKPLRNRFEVLKRDLSKGVI